MSHMFPRDPADWGGIFVLEQVQALRRIGVDARVLVGNVKILTRATLRPRTIQPYLGRAQEVRWQDMAGVPTAYVDFLAAYPPWWGYVAPTSYLREIQRVAVPLLSAFPFEIVHGHTAFLDGSAAAWLARRFRTPFVLTEHTGPFSALTAQPIMRRQTERAINSADMIIAVSETLRRDILSQVRVRDAARIRIIGNGVDHAMFRPEGSSPPDDGTVRALWIGGFLPVKQPLVLIDAFAMASSQDRRLRLSMVGTGPLEADIRAHIRRQGVEALVSVLPSATRPAIADHMRRHHFLVMSSESETFGLVVIEALACGRPVLSTRCGGPEETIQGSQYGELVGNSAEDLAKGFLTMATRLSEFDAGALHEFARRRYGLEVIATRVKETYLEVLHGREVR